MIYPEGDAIKERITNRYSLVVLAAKRARQLKEGAPALIDTQSANALTVALEEIAAGKIDFIEGVEVRRDDESYGGDAIDAAAALEDGFLSPIDGRAPQSPLSEALAPFLDSPAMDAGDEAEIDAETADDEDTAEDAIDEDADSDEDEPVVGDDAEA